MSSTNETEINDKEQKDVIPGFKTFQDFTKVKNDNTTSVLVTCLLF